MLIMNWYFMLFFSICLQVVLICCIGIVLILDVILCFVQKLSIFCVFVILLISEFVRWWCLKIRLNICGDGWLCFGVLMSVIVLLCLSRCRNGFRLCCVVIVFRMKLKLFRCVFICVLFFEIMILCVLSCLLFLIFDGDVVNSMMCVFIVCVSFIFMWLRLLRLMMLIFLLGLMFYCCSGEQVVIFVYSSGVVLVGLSVFGMCSMNVLLMMSCVEQLLYVMLFVMWFWLLQVLMKLFL